MPSRCRNWSKQDRAITAIDRRYWFDSEELGPPGCGSGMFSPTVTSDTNSNLPACIHFEKSGTGGIHLSVDNGDRPGPARRGALDLHRKARHGETGRGQLLEIVQLFDVAIADMAARLLA